MVQERRTNSVYPGSSLKIKKDYFCKLINQQIFKGQELLDREVLSSGVKDNFRAYSFVNSRGTKVLYDETAEKSFIEDFERWHDYNKEIYRTVFEDPNNIYRHDYESCWVVIWGKDTIKEYKDNIRRFINKMKGDIEKIDLIPSLVLDNSEEKARMMDKDMKSVFIVHGHDDAAINEVKIFLINLGLKPIVLREQASAGKTIIEKIEEYTNVDFSIVLYTPCDEGKAKREDSYNDRARQNVVFEHGYLCAKLGRENVCALVKGNIEIPGDISGVVFVPMEKGWEYQVAKELKKANYQINVNGLL